MDERSVCLMQQIWSVRLIRLASILGVVGVVLGAHMAGAGSYAFLPVHAHILVVGWLSLFAWGIFYKLFPTRNEKLVATQGWTAVIGTIGLALGFAFNNLQPFGDAKAIYLAVYIGGGVILLLSFTLFMVVTFSVKKPLRSEQ